MINNAFSVFHLYLNSLLLTHVYIYIKHQENLLDVEIGLERKQEQGVTMINVIFTTTSYRPTGSPLKFYF